MKNYEKEQILPLHSFSPHPQPKIFKKLYLPITMTEKHDFMIAINQTNDNLTARCNFRSQHKKTQKNVRAAIKKLDF